MNTEPTEEFQTAELQTESFQWILDDDASETIEMLPMDSALTDSAASFPQNDGITSVEELQRSVSKPRETIIERSLAPIYPVSEPYVGVNALPPIPEAPVNTAPRPVTIVWGFVIMAIGILAISMAAGATVDLGLVLVWLPAICGIALIAAAILAALKKNRLPQ